MNRNTAREGGGKKNASTSSNKNGVIITVYTENPIQYSTRRPTPIKTKWTRNRRPGGYSRRAQLLAYTRELRNGDQDPPMLKYQRVYNKFVILSFKENVLIKRDCMIWWINRRRDGLLYRRVFKFGSIVCFEGRTRDGCMSGLSQTVKNRIKGAAPNASSAWGRRRQLQKRLEKQLLG